MISPSVPHLRLAENGVQGRGSVTFIGFFELEKQPGDVELSLVRTPDEFELSQVANGAAHRLVKVAFDGINLARVSPAVSDIEVISESLFDWSRVPGGIASGGSAEDSVENFGDLWRVTGLCPDPRMYEVQDSRWLQDLGLTATAWRHFIMLGHDEYVEIVAQRFDWQPGQALD
jgi:hypothetical protein